LRWLLAGLFACVATAHAEAPAGFVKLSEIDPTIVQIMGYAGSDNFIGRPIAGYQAPVCYLTRQAAETLKGVQAELLKQNMKLVVWDCYRPRKAVLDFLSWSTDPKSQSMKSEFYPREDKATLFNRGYVARHSAHSSGSTVDLGIISVDGHAAPTKDQCGAYPRLPTNESLLDFGTGLDCLDVQAGTGAVGLTDQQKENRKLLADLMTTAGFRPYSKEWWHFQLANEPFPKREFDFDVK